MSKEPQKLTFSNDFVLSSAMNILDVRPNTGAHHLLIKKLRESRTEKDEQTPMTYAECCDHIKTLIDAYEREDD